MKERDEREWKRMKKTDWEGKGKKENERKRRWRRRRRKKKKKEEREGTFHHVSSLHPRYYPSQSPLRMTAAGPPTPPETQQMTFSQKSSFLSWQCHLHWRSSRNSPFSEWSTSEKVGKEKRWEGERGLGGMAGVIPKKEMSGSRVGKWNKKGKEKKCFKNSNSKMKFELMNGSMMITIIFFCSFWFIYAWLLIMNNYRAPFQTKKKRK